MFEILRVAALALVLGQASIFAPEDNVSLGGFLCARPLAPRCATVLTDKSPAQDLGDCQHELELYANATRVYRECLQKLMADELRHVNDVLDQFRCRTRLQCPTLPAAAARPPRTSPEANAPPGTKAALQGGAKAKPTP